MGDIKCQLDKDFATVTEWGEACPSLLGITLPRECRELSIAAIFLSIYHLIDFG